MRPVFPWKDSLLKPVLAGLVAAFFVGILTIGASQRLHGEIHAAEAEHSHSPCVVCALVKSQVDVPVIPGWEVFASVSVVWTVSFPVAPVPESVDLLAAPNRGPPASVAFLS
jgi:hypothetical protein